MHVTSRHAHYPPVDLDDAAVSWGRRTAELAARHPDRVALVFAAADGTERSLTQGELETDARAAAHVMARAGVTEGDIVAIALPNSPEHVCATLGAWKLGACVVPLRADLPDWERGRILDVVQPQLLIGDWGDSASESGGPPVLSRAAFASAATRLPHDTADEFPDRVAYPAMAVASGGATGRPKLIVTPTPGTSVPGLAAATSVSPYPTGAGHVQLVPGPLYHTNGFAITQMSLFEEQLVVLMEAFDPARVVHLIERHRVTLMTMAPTMLLRVARLPEVRSRDFSSIQGVMQGAASCPQWLLHTWIDLIGAERLYIAYGSTERVGLTMIRGDEWLEHPGSVGRGLLTDVRVLDDDGNDSAHGHVGEIYLRSQVTLDAPTFDYVGAPPPPRTADGFTSIGDLGWLDPDGYLYIADRRVDMIVTGGANVFPAEVEAALSEHPGVADAAVIGLPDEEWGHRVVAIVEPVDRKASPSAAELDAHARARLAAYKVPREFELVDVLPRTPAGKLNRSALVTARSRSTEATAERAGAAPHPSGG